MANEGFCPALLDHMEVIAGRAYPGNKATAQGFFLSLLNSVDQPEAISGVISQDGHIKTLQYEYSVRATVGQVANTISCDNTYTHAKKVTSVTLPYISYINVYFPDDTIRQYCNEASAMTSTPGGQPTKVMNEVLRGLYNAANAIYASTETNLTTAMAPKFGLNKRTNTQTPTLNIPLTGTSNNLSEGHYVILSDAVRHEFCASPIVVGNGKFTNWDLANRAKALSFNQSGVDYSQMMDALGYQYYNSQITASTWGADEIGVFDQGSVHFVQHLENRGSFSGQRGVDFFGRFVDNRVQCWTPGGYQNVELDMHVRYLPCPTAVANGYSGGTTTYQRGWLVSLYHTYGLFTIPTDAYDGADVLSGNNGTLNYGITNN